MSLADELEAEPARHYHARSQIDEFLDGLTEQDRADVEAWIKAGKNKRVLWRVLKRRGLPVAESTFRNWCNNQCR